MLTQILDCFNYRPIVASGTSIGSFIAGALFNLIPTNFSQVMQVVTPILQNTAFVVSIIVGLATLRGLYYKHKKEKKSKK